MPSKILERLRHSTRRSKQQNLAPAYSMTPPNEENEDSESPPYEELDTFGSLARRQRPALLRRNPPESSATESSLTSAELTRWNDAANQSQRGEAEELPVYEERLAQPDWTTYMWYLALANIPRTKRPNPMCPCAQCYSLR